MAKKERLEWDLVVRLKEGRTNGSHLRHYVSPSDLEAAETIATLRREVEQANADCKRANELTNAAIDDYNTTIKRLGEAVTAHNELVEELRQAHKTYGEMIAEARAKALEEAQDAVREAWNGYGVSLVRINDAIRSLADKEG